MSCIKEDLFQGLKFYARHIIQGLLTYAIVNHILFLILNLQPFQEQNLFLGLNLSHFVLQIGNNDIYIFFLLHT